MHKLYTDLAHVFQIMYQHFIDYNEEFAYYHAILQPHHAQTVLEIGCGTGNIAQRMVAHNYQYTGMDISPDMLQIAQQQVPNAHFVQADMRHFNTPNKQQAVLILGRTISYLLSDQDMFDALKAIYNCLDTNGLLVFDIIDANKFIPLIQQQPKVVHTAPYQTDLYIRESTFTLNTQNVWTWDWAATYFVQTPNQPKQQIATDQSTARAFTANEISLFLQLTGFNILQQYSRPSYAFDTIVFVAQKTNAIKQQTT